MSAIPIPTTDLGPISPELCLVDPELARAARALLPAWPPPSETQRAGRAPAALPRVAVVAAALVALVALVPSAAVRGAVPVRLTHPAGDAAVGTTIGGQSVLAVPDVSRLVYVFAKHELQDAGLAWKVVGDVEGYAGNRVLRQDPLPGTLVVDTGAPTVSLVLGHNPGYLERGTPEQEAPYPGTRVKLWTPAGTAKSARTPSRRG